MRGGSLVGVLLAVALLGLATLPVAGASHPTSAASAHWVPSRSGSVLVWNCSTERSSVPRFSSATLVGTWAASAEAVACGAGRGGPGMDSYVLSSENLTVSTPIRLLATDHGVRVGWDLDLAASTRASYGATVGGCPFTETNYTIVNASTTFYYSFDYQWCDVEAVADVSGSAELIDLTTGVVLSSANSWAGLHLASGVQTITYGFFGSYSNRSYWAWNYTDWQSLNYTFGTSSSVSGLLAPTWWINGTFVSSDRYVLETGLTASIAVESFRYTAGNATASLDAARGGHAETLVPFVVY